MRDVLTEDEGGIEGGVEEGFQLGVEGQAFLERGGGHDACACRWGGSEGGKGGMRSLFVLRLVLLLSLAVIF